MQYNGTTDVYRRPLYTDDVTSQQQQAGGMRRRLFDDDEARDVRHIDEIQRQRERRVQFDDHQLTSRGVGLLTADLSATKYHIGM